jgi:hypothetical protein
LPADGARYQRYQGLAGFGHDLAELCRRFESDPTIGDRGQLLHSEFLADGPQFPFAETVAGLLRES